MIIVKSRGSKYFDERYPHSPMPSTAPSQDQNSSPTPTPGGLIAPPFIFVRYSDKLIVFYTNFPLTSFLSPRGEGVFATLALLGTGPG
jgi:hypothetical protein